MAHQIEEDFPPSLACLKNIDALLRCPICFDFLNITLMTKCSHNFCSLCIRKFLSYKLLCPVCNTEMTEQDLRNNRLLDDLVGNFQTARQELSKANFESPPISPKTPASAVKCKTPRERGPKPSNSILSHFFQKKHRTPPSKESQQDVHRGQMRGAQTQWAKKSDLHSGKARTPVVVKEEPMDEEYPSSKCLMSVKQEDAASHSQSPTFEMAHSSSPSQDVKPIIKGEAISAVGLEQCVIPEVECPVCSVSVAQHFINKHLDTCLTSEEKKDSLRSSQSKTMRPMAKLVYNLLSVQELKRRLKECHLSVQGSRDQLIKRHHNFVLLYNSQCDSLNPKSAEEIAKEVEANEKIRNQLQGKTRPVMVFSKNQSEKEIDEMNSNYRKQHSSDFSRLIAQVKGRLGKPKQAQGVSVAKEGTPASKSSETKSSIAIKVEDEAVDEDPPPERIDLSYSPTLSDVSISSSISDIFGPESSMNIEATEQPSAQKRPFSSTGSDAEASPAVGKRQRKT